MLKINCPSCGAEVVFITSIAVFTVCPYCRSTIVRHDRDVEAVGKMALLQDEWSALQLQTSGKYRGVTFTLVGRVRLSWESGNWNEWFCYFDDAQHGWLSEAQGFYQISVPCAAGQLPALNEVTTGLSISIAAHSYTVKDIKKVKCTYSEGELPFKAVLGRSSVSVDLASTGNNFACIDYSEDGVNVYSGEYCKFEEFRFSYLRELDGWRKPS